MDPISIVVTIFWIVILLVLTGIYSGCEVAFSATNRIRIKNKADLGSKSASRVLKMIDDYDRTITTILIAGNLFYVILSVFVTLLFVQLLGAVNGPIVASIFLLIMILIFGDSLPKIYAKNNTESMALTFSWFINFTINILRPFTFIVMFVQKFFNEHIKSNEEVDADEVEEEILSLIDEQSEQVFDDQEKQLIKNILEFDDILVGEIQKPRRDIVAIDINSSEKEIIDLIEREKFARIPVYDGDLDNIIGIMIEREYLETKIKKGKVNLKSILREPLFVPATMKISNLLPELQKTKTHVAIVLEEAGGVQGLITMEDILEEIVGEIWDEHDDAIDASKIVKVNKNTYQVWGECETEDFYNEIDIPLPDDVESTTMAGYVQELAQTIPEANVDYSYENLTFKVLEMKERRIIKIQVTVHERE